MERRLLVKKRQEIQNKLALAKGRSSKAVFSLGDKVHVKNHLGGRWDKSGTVIEERSTGTASPPSSFVVQFNDGSSGLHHKSYLKHEVLDPDVEVADGISGSGSMASTAAIGSFVAGTSFDANDATGPMTRSRARKEQG